MRSRARAIRLALVSAVAVLLAGVGATFAVGPSGHAASAVNSPPAAYASGQSAVLRIAATGCFGTNLGSGFLLSSHLVATAAHVVRGAAVVAVSNGQATSAAVVVGLDAGTDVALLRVDTRLAGRPLRLDDSAPSDGASLTVVGYPQNGPLEVSNGVVTGLDRGLVVTGSTHTGLIETDAAIHPGDSGAPLLSRRGEVVGIADATSASDPAAGFAVPSTAAAPLLESWRHAAPLPSPPCGVPAAVMGAMTTYFDAADTGDRAAALALLTAAVREKGAGSPFPAPRAATYYYDIIMGAPPDQAKGRYRLDAAFTSRRAGDSCDNWTVVFTLTRADTGWLITGARGQAGVAYQRC